MPATLQVVVPTMRLSDEIICKQLLIAPSLLCAICNTSEHNRGVLGSLQLGYEMTTTPVIAYIHDDVEIYDDNWIERVLKEFEVPCVCGHPYGDHMFKDGYCCNPKQQTDLQRRGVIAGDSVTQADDMPLPITWHIGPVLIPCHKGCKEYVANTSLPPVGVVGFGGGLRHGSRDLYKTPYRLQQLARFNYRSNMKDAEVHGERFAGECDVAVLDGFSLIVRRRLLDECGGWPVDNFPAHHSYDYFICCLAHRYGYRVRLVGVRCHHMGGLTATTPAYQDWARTTRWGSDAGMHEASHRLIYSEFNDVLPFEAA